MLRLDSRRAAGHGRGASGSSASPESATRVPSGGVGTDGTNFGDPSILQGINWRAASERALADIREQRAVEEGYRTFSIDDLRSGSATKGKGEGEGAGKRTRSIFEQMSAERAGLTYKDATGATVRWITGDCSSTSDGFGHAFAFPDSVLAADLPVVVCGRSKPRSDLFESAKPTYLRNPSTQHRGEIRDDER